MHDIIKQLTLLPCFTKISEIQNIEEGASHNCFKVLTKDGSYFAKYFETTRATREIEHNVTILAAKAMLSPAVLYQSEQWLITEYINDSGVIDELNTTEKVLIMTELLSKCHRLTFDLPTLDLKKVLNNIISDLLLSSKSLTHMRSIITKLPTIENNQPLVVCHGDVNFSNVIFAENSFLVDFECASLAEPEYDLAMMIAINLLNGEHQVMLLSHYAKMAAITLSHTKLMSYLSYCYLINGLWYLSKFKDIGRSELLNLSLKQFTAFDNLMDLNARDVVEMR